MLGNHIFKHVFGVSIRSMQHFTVGIIGLIGVLCGSFIKCSSGPEVFEITVYPANEWLMEIFVFWDKRTWLEARESCRAQGMDLYFGWTGQYYHDYVVGNALRQNRSDFESLWLGGLTPEGTDTWFYSKSTFNCKKFNSKPNVIVGPKFSLLCQMLNASAPFEENVYGVPCNTISAYACKKGRGYYNGSKDSYVMYERARADTSEFFVVNSSSVLSLDECVHWLFRLDLPMAEYNGIENSTGSCTIFTCPSQILPMNITLEAVIENFVTITATDTVSFKERNDTIDVSSAVYPCQLSETTTNDITTTAETVMSSTATCCSCQRYTNNTANQVHSSTENLREELLLDSKKLSSYKRRKGSASDNRPTSITMGTVAVLVLVFVASAIIFLDFHVAVIPKNKASS